jgi:LysM repeat protein
MNGNYQAAVECERRQLKVEDVIGEGSQQIIVKNEIEFPVCPKKISHVDTEIKDLEYEIIKDKVLVEGVLHKQILYVSQETNEVLELSVDHAFTGYVDIPGAAPGMEAESDVVVEHVDHKLNAEECEAIQTVVLEITVRVIDVKDIDIITDIPGVEVEKIPLTLQEVIAEGTKQVIVENDLEFPRLVRKISSTDCEIRNIETEVLKDKVIVNGILHKQVFYVAAETNEVYEKSFDEPFTGYVDLPGIIPDTEVQVKVECETVKYDFEPGEDEAEQTAVLKIYAKAIEDTEVEVVTDILDEDIDFETEVLKVQDVVGEGSNQIIVKNEIEFPKPIKKIARTDVDIRDIETEILPDKVIVEGILHKQIFYVEQGTGKVFELSVDEKFTGYVDVEGARDGMNAHVKVEVEQISYDFDPGECEAEQTAVLEIKVKVTEPKEITVVTDADVCPADGTTAPKPTATAGAMMTFYTVQPGDTLYKIAKRYGVSVESIVAKNDIKNPDMIFPGMKLEIPYTKKG